MAETAQTDRLNEKDALTINLKKKHYHFQPKDKKKFCIKQVRVQKPQNMIHSRVIFLIDCCFCFQNTCKLTVERVVLFFKFIEASKCLLLYKQTSENSSNEISTLILIIEFRMLNYVLIFEIIVFELNQIVITYYFSNNTFYFIH